MTEALFEVLFGKRGILGFRRIWGSETPKFGVPGPGSGGGPGTRFAGDFGTFLAPRGYSMAKVWVRGPKSPREKGGPRWASIDHFLRGKPYKSPPKVRELFRGGQKFHVLFGPDS